MLLPERSPNKTLSIFLTGALGLAGLTGCKDTPPAQQSSGAHHEAAAGGNSADHKSGFKHPVNAGAAKHNYSLGNISCKVAFAKEGKQVHVRVTTHPADVQDISTKYDWSSTTGHVDGEHWGTDFSAPGGENGDGLGRHATNGSATIHYSYGKDHARIRTASCRTAPISGA